MGENVMLPEGFEIESTPQPTAQNTGLPEGFEVEESAPKSSAGESAGLGFAKGASFGGLAMIPAVGLKTFFKQPLKEDVTLSTGETFKSGEVPSFEDRLQIGREQQKHAEESHPIINTAAQIVGGLAPAVLPGGGVATGIKSGVGGAKAAAEIGAKVAPAVAKSFIKELPKNILRGAGEGALSGVGYSEAIGSKDPNALAKGAEAAVSGGLLGGAVGGALPIIGKGIKALKGKTGARILSGVTEVDEEAIKYAMNPATRAKMATTKTMPVIGEEIVQKADDVVNNIRKQSGESFRILKGSDKVESVYNIGTIIDDVKKELTGKNKIGTYDAVLGDLDAIGNRLLQEYQLPSGQAAKAVPLDDIKNIIWSLDDKIVHKESALKPLSPAERVSNNAYKELRGKLNDRLRTLTKDETGKSAYAEVMDKISGEMQDMKNFRDAFKNNPETIGKQISEYMKLERLGRDKTEKLKNLDTIAKYAGKDWMDEAKAVWSRDQFEKQIGKGSTNANIGIVAGGAIVGSALMATGIPAPIAYAIGGTIGGVFGKIFNSYGSRMTKYMLEKYIESAEGKVASNVPHLIKKPMAEFTRAMQAIPDSAQRKAVVNAMLQHESLNKSEQSQAPTPQGIKYAFDQVAR